MPNLFSTENLRTTPIELSALREIDEHQLLDKTVSFDQVKEIGQLFLQAGSKLNFQFPSDQPLPQKMLTRFERLGHSVFMAKLVRGVTSDDHYPVTAEIVHTPQGLDLKFHILSIKYSALEVAQHGSHHDGLLALAAAAAVAPQFKFELQEGLTLVEHCETQDQATTSLGAHHGTPIEALFESFTNQTTTLDTAIATTANPLLSLKDSGHFHGLDSKPIQNITKASNTSRIAAGVVIREVMRSQLGAHILYVPTDLNDQGRPRILTMTEMLMTETQPDLSLMAMALAVTDQVIHHDVRTKKLEKVLTAKSADTPLITLLK